MKRLIDAIKAHSGLEDDEIIQAGEHGADAGWAGFTYTSDCCEFYASHKELVWELLAETADDQGVKPLELVASFGRSDMADTPDGFENLLAWFALEEAGRWLADNRQACEPEEDDLTTTDHLHFYQSGKLVLVVSDVESMAGQVKAFMESEGFFPNVWFISDHGNAHPINLEE